MYRIPSDSNTILKIKLHEYVVVINFIILFNKLLIIDILFLVKIYRVNLIKRLTDF